MAKIMGGVTATNMPVPDWDQTNPLKADYIKNKPGYAGITVPGLVKLATLCGLKMGTGSQEGILYVDQAPESIFPYRPSTGSTMPITVGNVDFAVKTCLTDGKQVVTWKPEEQQAARALLNAATKDIEGTVSTLDSKVKEISDALNECYERIETINVTEEDTKAITRTLPNVKRLKMKMMAPAGTAQGLVIVRTFCNDTQIGSSSITGGIHTGTRCSGAEFYKNCGYWDGYTNGAISDAGSPSQLSGMSYNYTLTKAVETYPHIDKVTITSQSANVNFPVGTTIELWGVKHNEN